MLYRIAALLDVVRAIQGGQRPSHLAHHWRSHVSVALGIMILESDMLVPRTCGDGLALLMWRRTIASSVVAMETMSFS